jgi:hypothetical protein
MQVRLKPKNHYAKNRINQHGEWWEVTSVSISKKKMWLESLDYTFRVRPFVMATNTRSILIENDPDFEIAEYRNDIEPVIDRQERSYPLLREVLGMK